MAFHVTRTNTMTNGRAVRITSHHIATMYGALRRMGQSPAVARGAIAAHLVISGLMPVRQDALNYAGLYIY